MEDTEFRKRLRAARLRAGMSMKDVEFQLRVELPKPMWVSEATISRLETKGVEADVEPFLIGVLSRVYGVPVSALSVVARERLEGLRPFIEQIDLSADDNTSDLGINGSPCNPDGSPRDLQLCGA